MTKEELIEEVKRIQNMSIKEINDLFGRAGVSTKTGGTVETPKPKTIERPPNMERHHMQSVAQSKHHRAKLITMMALEFPDLKRKHFSGDCASVRTLGHCKWEANFCAMERILMYVREDAGEFAKPKSVVEEIWLEIRKQYYVGQEPRAVQALIEAVEWLDAFIESYPKETQLPLTQVLRCLQGKKTQEIPAPTKPVSRFKPYWTCSGCKGTNADHWTDCLICGEKRAG